MGKDKGKNIRSSKGSSSTPGAGGFIGFSAFTTNLSNATDPEYKLQKKDELSRIKALDELNVLFAKIDVESPDFNVTSIRALIGAWEFMFKKLVNDDDRKVREMSCICLGTLGARVGKNLGPHVKTLLGPWIFSICDQKDQSNNNTALQSFNTIFPEKKRRDVFRFAHDQALEYLCENLQETSTSMGDGRNVAPEVLQERYERCIANSLLAIEFLIEATFVAGEESPQSAIYEKTLEDKFLGLLASKSSHIRRTCYRLMTTVINKVPAYADANIADLSSKVLGLFSEKDATTHLFMWDAIISFLKKYKEKAWEGVDARKHVLPRFWAFLRSGAYGSHVLSYPMVLPFLTFVPDHIVGQGPAFFEEFFGNMAKGLEVLEGIKQFGSSERATTYLLNSFVECIVYSAKRWSTNETIVSHLVDKVYTPLFSTYFSVEASPYTDNAASLAIADTTRRLLALNNPQIQSLLATAFDGLFDTKRIVMGETTSITVATHYSRLSSIFARMQDIPLAQSLSKQLFLFACQHFNHSDEVVQENVFELVSILLSHFNIQILLEPEIKDTQEFIKSSILPNLKSANNDKSINNLFTIFAIIMNGQQQQDLTESWTSVLEMFREGDVTHLIKLLDMLTCDRQKLANPLLDTIVAKYIHSNENDLYKRCGSKQHSLLSVLLVSNDSTFNSIITSITGELSDLVERIVMNGDVEFDAEYLKYASTFVFANVTDQTSAKTRLLETIVQCMIKLHHVVGHDTKRYTEQFSEVLDQIFKQKGTNNDMPIATLFPLLLNQLLSIHSPDFQFFKRITIDVINKNPACFDDLLSLYLAKHDEEFSKTVPVSVSWLNGSITLFEQPKNTIGAETQERYQRLHLYILSIIEHMLTVDHDIIASFEENAQSDRLFVDLLVGLVTIDCNNTLTPTLVALQSMHALRTEILSTIINAYDDLYTLVWLNRIVDQSLLANGFLYTIVLKNIVNSLASSSSSFKLDFSTHICTKYLGNSLDGALKSHQHVNLLQVMLPLLVVDHRAFVDSMRQSLVKDLEGLSPSIPTALDSIACKVALVSSILSEDDERPITDDEGHVLLKVLQIIQQWYLRSRSEIMKDQQITFDALEVPLASFFIVVAQYAVAKKLFLSSNQSQLINKLVQAFFLSEEDKDTEYIIAKDLEAILSNFELWKQLKNSKDDSILISKVVGHLMVWSLLLKNYSIQDATKRSAINSYLSSKKLISTLLTSAFYVINKDAVPEELQHSAFPHPDQLNYSGLETICGHMIYVVVKHLPSMARCWWSDDCNSKMAPLADNYISSHISPHIIKNEIHLVNGHKEQPDSNFSVRASYTNKEVNANYEKDEMTVSLVLQIPESYPLRVLSVEFSKRVGVTEMQWRKWLLSMTSLLLTQDGSILDACLLWRTSLDKHFQGVDLCPICYSLFFNGTIPKFQCRTCKNKFHAGCIYKWFSTSHKSTCPLCQTELQ
eukprot:gene1206-1393_t